MLSSSLKVSTLLIHLQSFITIMDALIRENLKQVFLFYIFATCVLASIFISYIFNGHSTEGMDLLGWGYFITSCIIHAALFMLLPFAVIHVPLTLLHCNRKLSNILLIILCTFLFVLAVINGYVYRIYHFHINGLILEMITSSGASDIFIFSSWEYIKATVWIICLLLISVLISKLSIFITNRFNFKHLRRNLVYAILICGLLSQSIHIYGGATMNASIIESTDVIPYYFPLRANKLLAKLGIIDYNKLYQIRFQNTTNKLSYPLHPLRFDKNASFSKKSEPYNIVILCIDSWNPRTFTQDCTPNIYRFAQESEQYTHHLSSSNATSGGIFGMFTGLSAYYWKSFDYGNIQPLLISTLLKAGYTIQTYPSATLEYPPFAKMLFHDVKNINISTPGNTSYERDINITRKFIQDIDNYDGKQPFFSFVFYDLAHSMELPVAKQNRFQPSWEHTDYMKLDNDLDPQPFFNLYKNCVYEVDSLIGLTLNKLKSHNLLNNTIVIITGDHGQEFNENHNNYWGHASNYCANQVAVPFIYYYPSCKPSKNNYRTTHYDIVPTLMHTVLGVSNPPSDYSMGRYLHDRSSRDWHLVGHELYYAFIRSDGSIIEKQGTGNLKIMDYYMRPLSKYKLNPRELQMVIQQMNRFYRK